MKLSNTSRNTDVRTAQLVALGVVMIAVALYGFATGALARTIAIEAGITVLFLLPQSRNETATSAAPVKSSTVNSLQDCVVGMKRPSAWRWVAPTTPLVQPTGSNTLAEDGFQFGSSGSFAGMSVVRIRKAIESPRSRSSISATPPRGARSTS